MSNYYAEVEAGKVRRKAKLLVEQCLSRPALRGYEVAIQRGLLHLVLDYQDELLRWEKAKGRLKAAKEGDNLSETGEDQGLERLYQKLLVQRVWLTQQGYLPSKLNDESWLKAITAAMA